MRPLPLVLAVAALLGPAGCSLGGAYVPVPREGGKDRGETNGRMFDFVSNKPDGDQWTIRIRGSSLYVAYALEARADDLGTVNLTRKETDRVWELIDAVDVPTRKRGKEDRKDGFVQLQLREPGEDQHEVFKAYVSRANPDDDVTELAIYLRALVAKYHREEPNF